MQTQRSSGSLTIKSIVKILPAKHCSCTSQSCALDFSLREQLSMFSSARALPACPECVLAAPVLVGDWAFVSWMLQMCWWEELWEEGLAHSRKVGGVCSAELAVHSPCSCSHLCSCSAHLGCSAAVPLLLFEQNRVTPSWESWQAHSALGHRALNVPLLSTGGTYSNLQTTTHKFIYTFHWKGDQEWEQSHAWKGSKDM